MYILYEEYKGWLAKKINKNSLPYKRSLFQTPIAGPPDFQLIVSFKLAIPADYFCFSNLSCWIPISRVITYNPEIFYKTRDPEATGPFTHHCVAVTSRPLFIHNYSYFKNEISYSL